MSVIQFGELPDAARLWIYGSEKPFDDDQIPFLIERMNRFLEHWTSHERELTAGWELRYNQFIQVGVDESTTGVSGCSIDSLVHNLKELQQTFGLDIINTNSKVFYRDKSNKIQCVERPEFKHLVGQSIVDADTIVFNNTVQTLGELRQGKWEVPMKESWHQEAFGVLV